MRCLIVELIAWVLPRRKSIHDSLAGYIGVSSDRFQQLLDG
ncbi:hypothetical protein [Desulfofundulus salinus]|nr:hypothetical protein [Desulfofundulus salinum]